MQRHQNYLRRQFDGLVYVYAYIDPWTDEPFYIGHGSADRDTAYLRRHDTPFWHRVQWLRDSLWPPQVIRVAEGLTRSEAVSLARFLIVSLGCKGCDSNPGPLLNRDHCLVDVRPGRGVSRVIQNGKPIWVATFYRQWIGRADTYEEALRIRQDEEKRAAGMSRRAWEKNWRNRKLPH